MTTITKRKMTVRDLMTETVLSLGVESDLAAAKDLMWEHNVRHVPIVDETGELAGLVTHRDLLPFSESGSSELPLSAWGDMMHRTSLGDVMTSDVISIEPDADLHLAAQTMLENKYGCLPVVEGGHLCGILTESDFVRCFAEGE